MHSMFVFVTCIPKRVNLNFNKIYFIVSNHYLFVALIGIDCYGGLITQELEEIRSSLPNDMGGDIVRCALTRLAIRILRLSVVPAATLTAAI